MSADYAAQLVAVIDKLLDDLHVYRRLPRPTIRDSDELVLLHRNVTHLALAAGFAPPPSMAESGLKICNPHDIKNWPPNPPPDWRSPNSHAGVAWEGAMRDLQAQARAATAVPSTPATDCVAGVSAAHDATTPKERCLAAILAHRADNWSARQLAGHLGISRATLYRWLQEDQTLAAAWEGIKREPQRGHIDQSEDGPGTVDAAE
jgi:hypothetical protein